MKSVPGFITIFAIIMTVISCPGSIERKNFITDSDLESGNISLQYNQALVAFASGDVTVSSADIWVPVEVGDCLAESQTIRIGARSFAELVLGDRANVRIEENSEVRISRLSLVPDEAQVRLEVEAGSVLCKVAVFGSGETFKVRTRTAICGVRGTEFGVTVLESEDTALSVKTGKVAILPSSADVEELKDEASKDAGVIAILDDFEKNAPVVEADQEMVISQDTVKETEERFQRVRQEVTRLSENRDRPVTPEDREGLRALVAQSRSDITSRMGPRGEIPAERREQLQRIDAMRMHDIPVVPIRGPGERPENRPSMPPRPALEFIRLGIMTIPQDASIYLNGSFQGFGKAQGLFTPGVTIDVRIAKEGFESKEFSFTVKKDGQRVFEVKLEETGRGNSREGQGQDNKPGDNNGNPDRFIGPDRSIGPDRPNGPNREIAQIAKPGNRPFVGDLVVAGNLIVGADADGRLFALDQTGHVAWTASTENTPNQASSPVFANGKIYFSGKAELVIIDAAGGRVLNRIKLDAGSSHMFGRRIVPAGELVLLPTDNSIRMLDGRSGSVVKEIPIQGPVSMTPSMWKGTAVIVNSLGSVVFVNLETGKADPFPIQTRASEPVGLSITFAGSRGYFADKKNNVVCVDLDAKRVIWERRIDSADYPTQNLLPGNAGVYVYAGRRIFGFAHDGNPLFTLDNVSAAPAYMQGRLIVPMADSSVKLVDERTGTVYWSLALKSPVTARPLVARAGIVVGTKAGEIIFIKPAI